MQYFFLTFLNDLFCLFTNTKTYNFVLFTEMLAQFTDTEELDGEIYHCDRCNGNIYSFISVIEYIFYKDFLGSPAAFVDLLFFVPLRSPIQKVVRSLSKKSIYQMYFRFNGLMSS